MTRRNNVWSVDLAGGGVRQGRDTYYDVFPISVTLITSALGRQAFLSFLEKVDGGASSFWMAHDFGMGIEDYQVTITSTIAESTEDGINWTITFTATAEKSPFQDEDNQCLVHNLPDLYGCYGDYLGGFLKAYGEAQSTFPRIWEPNVIASFDFNSRRFSGISFNRATMGTYFDGNNIKTAAVNAPRYETNGLLIENNSINLITQSLTFSDWVSSSATIATTGPSIIDSNQSNVITATGVNFPRIQNTITVSDGIYSLSFICRASTTNFAYGSIASISEGPAGFIRFYVDLTTGQFSTILSGTSVTLRGVSVNAIVGAWYKISVQLTISQGLTGVNVYVGPSRGLGLNTANIGDAVYFAHGQLERRSLSSSSILTPSFNYRSDDTLTLTALGVAKRVYREYTPLGSTTAIIETVPYTGELCPPGHVRVIKVLND